MGKHRIYKYISVLSMGGWGHAPPGIFLYFGFSEIVSDAI